MIAYGFLDKPISFLFCCLFHRINLHFIDHGTTQNVDINHLCTFFYITVELSNCINNITPSSSVLKLDCVCIIFRTSLCSYRLNIHGVTHIFFSKHKSIFFTPYIIMLLHLCCFLKPNILEQCSHFYHCAVTLLPAL